MGREAGVVRRHLSGIVALLFDVLSFALPRHPKWAKGKFSQIVGADRRSTLSKLNNGSIYRNGSDSSCQFESTLS